MTKLSAKSAITSTIVDANKGTLLLHAVKPGTPNVSYKVEDNKILQQVFANAAARAAAVPGFIGQLGYQIDTRAMYAATGISTGNWRLESSSGLYLPVLSDTSNIDSSTFNNFLYTQSGSIVSVSGIINIEPTSTSVTSFRISLPVATTFTGTDKASGLILKFNALEQGLVESEVSGTKLVVSFLAGGTSLAAYYMNFMYKIE